MDSPRCPSCTDTGTKACVGCKSVKYCSEECQQADWPSHKAFCKHFKNLPPRPSPDDRLIIVFAPNSTEPSLQWVDKRIGGKYRNLKDFSDGKFLKNDIFTGNEITGCKTGSEIFVYYDDNFIDNYPGNPNKAIVRITGGKLGWLWGGPVVVACGHRNGSGYLGTMEDVDPVVCSALAAWFICCHNNTEAHKKRMARKEEWEGKVQAVKATCAGERALTGAAEYVPVRIPILHPIFEDGQAEISTVSKAIDTPLLTWKAPHKKSWPPVDQATCNQKVCHMHKGLDPGAPFSLKHGGFGWSPQRWDLGLGNVLVMRRDLQPLTCGEVDAFGDFCLRHLPRYFQMMDERSELVEGDERGMRELEERVLAEATPRTWAAYLADWRKVRAGVLGDPEVNGRVDGKVRMGVTE